MTLLPTHVSNRLRGARGIQHWNSRLDDAQVRAIRARASDATCRHGGTRSPNNPQSFKAIAADFSISLSMVSRIVRRLNWRHVAGVVLVLCLGSLRLAAQTPSLPGDRLGFDQAAGTLADAQAYAYSGYFDGASTATLLTATCAGTISPFSCSAPLPPLLTGTHTVELTAKVILPDGRSAESAKSAAFSFRIFAAPNTPANIRIVPGAD